MIFRPRTTALLRSGGSHLGIIFTTEYSFPRQQPGTPPRLVEALDRLLAAPGEKESLEHWLVPPE